MNGKHIELFLVEGEPGRITTAEVAGWTGHVLAGPRRDLAAILRRHESARNGAYLLLGDDEESVDRVRCYIGRTENFANRFRDHDKKKDFWDRVVLISAKDDGFNEGHWGHLEAKLVELARRADRVTLMNDNTPQGRKLSEAQVSDVEAFIAQLQIVLPVLGVDAIRVRPTQEPVAKLEPDASPVFSLTHAKAGVDAKAQVYGDEFTMLSGSLVVPVWSGVGNAESTQRAYAGYRAHHERLVAEGSIVVDGSVGRLARDVAFTSPSLAGAIALGRSCNGRREWTWSGGNYAAWEDRGLDD